MADSGSTPSTGNGARKARPEFRNIHVSQIVSYRLPLAGIISILHRISGAAMFLIGLPVILYLFDQSITSELSFQNFSAAYANWFVKLVLIGLAWSFIHHFCCGIRYLMLDLHKGLEKGQAKNSATAVMAVSLPITLLVALKIFGAF
jgi:succinate dehydrogenase / fumarate reductase, cytochrome b subunit